jgi:hypothetical protein
MTQTGRAGRLTYPVVPRLGSESVADITARRPPTATAPAATTRHQAAATTRRAGGPSLHA